MGSATAWARRTYSGAAPPAQLDTGITNTSLSIVVDNGAGFPSTGPFFIVIDRGTPSEEKVEVASRSTNTFTVTSTTQRGVDGTAAVSHLAGATIEHCLTATDMDEANAASHYTIGQITTKGDLIAGTGAKATTRVQVGSNGTVLVADSGEAGGVGFGQVDTAGLANGAVETAKLDDDAVTGAKIEEAQRRMPGEVKMTAYSAPDTGWLLCDGSAVSRSTYSGLFAKIGTSFGAGDGVTTFELPNYENAFPVGAGDTYAVGASGGAAAHTLTEAELPGHTHDISLTSGNQSAQHSHGAGTYQTSTDGSHTHGVGGEPNTNLNIVKKHSGSSIDFTNANPSTDEVTYSRLDSAGSHSHTVEGSSAASISNHTHDVSGTTGPGGGSATPFATLPPYLAVHFQIKT